MGVSRAGGKGPSMSGGAKRPAKEGKGKYLLKVLLFIVALVAAIVLVPYPYSMLAAVGIVAGTILFDAIRHRILFKMAKRNFTRRKGTTALVIAGLMIGTAIISTSFVVGDTMDNMILKEITKGAGEISFVIGSPDDQGTAKYFNESVVGPLVQDIYSVDRVSYVAPVVMERFIVYDSNTQLSSKSPFLVMGTNGTSWAGFGGWTDVSGDIVLEAPSATGCYISANDAEGLGANVGDMVVLSRGSDVAQLFIERIVENYEPGVEGLSTAVFIDMDQMHDLIGNEGYTNYILVETESYKGDLYYYNADVREGIDAVIEPIADTTEIEVVADVKEVLDEGIESMSMFSDLFLVFGSFSVIAGIVLVINIFTMLGEERKSEMGMARALGMRRADLERLFTYEGLIYAVIAAAIGTLVGLAISYVMIWAISDMFDFFTVPMLEYFTFTAESLVIAFIGGFLITIATVYATTARISKLNIVRAVRNIPEPPVSRDDRKSFRLGIAGLVAGTLLMLIGIQGESAAPAYGGLSLITISMALVVRKWTGDRIAWNLAALVTLFIWFPKGGFYIFDYMGGIEMFIVSGLFMVTSALILVIFNSDALVRMVMKIMPVRNSYRAVLKTAASYPLRAKFRTGLSIFIFGLVIFTVTVLSMLSGIIDVNVDRMVVESSGGFDLIAVKQLSVPFQDDPWEIINTTGGFIEPGNVTNLISMPSMPLVANFTSADSMTGVDRSYERSTQVIGFSERFYTEGEFPLSYWDESSYSSESDVWDAALNDPGLVIVDGSWAASMGFAMGMPTGTVEVSQTMMV
ncbi:MAG: ABC transporter permease, partial [Methanomassiliicoccales archaeon]